MKLSEDEISLFNDSLDRCIANPQFLEIFYDKFTQGSSRVAELFASTDMRRQKRALKASLYTAMMATDGNRPAIDHLRALGERHHTLGIEADLYDLWLDTLLAAAAECDGFDREQTKDIWRQILAKAIRLMKSNA